MTLAELQIAYTIQEHLLRQSYLTEKQQQLLDRIKKQIKLCLEGTSVTNGKKT